MALIFTRKRMYVLIILHQIKRANDIWCPNAFHFSIKSNHIKIRNESIELKGSLLFHHQRLNYNMIQFDWGVNGNDMVESNVYSIVLCAHCTHNPNLWPLSNACESMLHAYTNVSVPMAVIQMKNCIHFV